MSVSSANIRVQVYSYPTRLFAADAYFVGYTSVTMNGTGGYALCSHILQGSDKFGLWRLDEWTVFSDDLADRNARLGITTDNRISGNQTTIYRYIGIKTSGANVATAQLPIAANWIEGKWFPLPPTGSNITFAVTVDTNTDTKVLTSCVYGSLVYPGNRPRPEALRQI